MLIEPAIGEQCARVLDNTNGADGADDMDVASNLDDVNVKIVTGGNEDADAGREINASCLGDRILEIAS